MELNQVNNGSDKHLQNHMTIKKKKDILGCLGMI